VNVPSAWAVLPAVGDELSQRRRGLGRQRRNGERRALALLYHLIHLVRVLLLFLFIIIIIIIIIII
jgi:hypothetical protein